MAARKKSRQAVPPRTRRKALAPGKSGDAGLKQQLAEARAQQAATAAILRVIARSPSDVQPVFDAIARNVLRLLGTHFSAVQVVRDGKLHLAGFAGPGFEKLQAYFPQPVDADTAATKALKAHRVVQIVPIVGNPQASERSKKLAKAFGYNAIITVPMVCDGKVIGAIATTRREAVPFNARQEALLKSFADQAVIAIENVRLFNETKEALERQTATAEVLSSMSGSMTDAQPVFESIVRSLRRLFGTRFTVLQLLRGDMVEMPAVDGDPGFERLRENYPRPLDETTVGGRAMLSKKAVQFAPVLDNPATPEATIQFARDFGFNSVIFTPMIHNGKVVGAIGTAHPDAKPFDDRQVALIKTFADQAVIAIENVRLFNETKEALERQTATAEILKVIASSPSNVQPVLEAIVNSAARLVEPCNATIVMRDGNRLPRLAIAGPRAVGIDLRKLDKEFPLAMDIADSPVARAIRESRTIDVPDTDAPDVIDRVRTFGRLAIAGAPKSFAIVPLLREGIGIGAIVLTTQTRGFKLNEKQLALVKTFADQAVIAIENVRLFNETKEALERQTATAEILKVIASSPSDVQPVFDAIVSSVARLFGRKAALRTVEAEGLRRRARSYDPEAGEFHGPDVEPLDRRSIVGQAVLEGRTLQWADTLVDGAATYGIEPARRLAFRSIASAPLMLGGQAIGVISVSSPEPGALSDKQLALLSTFADQAVIAIENVRLFNETKEALERQTATAEILKVIASSPSDVQPVFDAVAQSAARLFAPCLTGIVMREGEHLFLRAMGGPITADRDAVAKFYPYPFDPGTSLVSQSIASCQVMQILDSEAPDAPEASRVAGRALGFRSLTTAPLLRGGEGVGVISITSPQPGFKLSEKQLALLNTFADQAVIAIENVHLFNETREALERQTATAGILKVIAGSPSDVQPVFDAIVGSALRLMAGTTAHVTRLEGDKLHLLAFSTTDAEGEAALRSIYPLSIAGTSIAEALAAKQATFIVDAETDPDVPEHARAVMRARGVRSSIRMPMVSKNESIGTIVVNRKQAGQFFAHEIELLRTFADQAVIAIENVRLFNETKEALRRQTATAEILKVIASSPADVQPVFNAIVENAATLCDAVYSAVLSVENGMVKIGATVGWTGEGYELAQRLFPMPLETDHLSANAVRERRVIALNHLHSNPAVPPRSRELAKISGYDSIAIVPMVRGGEAKGALVVARRDTITNEQVALLQTFADQAVIAIENVRLFNETKEALERQTATAEILKVISSSPTDTQPVFDAIVQSGMRLFAGAGVGIGTVNGDGIVIQAALGMGGAGKGFRIPLSRESASGLAILEHKVVNIPDTEAPGVPPHARENGRRLNIRSMTQAPMFREGEPIGSIGVMRQEPGGLDDKQLALLKTFADQAVIAIENVRLFKELQLRTEALTKSVGQLTALGEVGQAISSSLDIETVLQTIVTRAVQLTGVDAGSIYEYDAQAEVYRLQAAEKMEPELVEAVRKTPIRKGDGATGRTAVTLEPVQVPDIEDKSYQGSRKDNLRRTGYRAVLAVPLLREDNLLGALQVFRRTPGPFAPEVVELLKTFATQSAMAIQNARLFREIAEKGKQLEVASRHKSDFLASMSHELRTPLNAILGFNEMILGQIYGEVPKDMQEPLEDIQKSGKHLLRLINNVLDLAKIEAGRMELALSDYSVHDTVESVRSTLRPLAAEKGLEFIAMLPNDLPLAHGDSGRITQCLMNLAGNSLKFTKAGKVEISVVARDDLLVFKVADTGVGIPPDKIDSLFTEFKQTDATIASEYGGTGLGLSISKKFVEMHGGRIWIESELGRGSAFIFEIPLRVKTP